MMALCNRIHSPTGPALWKKGSMGFIALLLATAGSFAATPVLEKIEAVGSGRGMALTLSADAAFPITISNKTPKKSMISVLSILCSNVIYGLNDYQFKTFPRGCPLQWISASENKKAGNVELVIKVQAPFDKNIRLKQKDKRWIILLTSSPVNDFTWSTQNGSSGLATRAEERVSTPTNLAAPPQGATSSLLNDITIMHRERVEKIIFQLDRPTEMIVKSLPEKIMVLFVNTKNDLSHGTFKSEQDWVVKSIELKEVLHGNSQWLGASIYINRETGGKPLVQVFPTRLVIYSVHESKQCLYLWSAKKGTAVSYTFITPHAPPIDYKKIEKKALLDSKNDFGSAGTFSVNEPVQQAKPQAVPTPAPLPPAIRIVIIKDKAGLFSAPSSAPGTKVIDHLPIGFVATQLEKKRGWLKIETGDAQGWIMAATGLDSVKVSQTIWKKIEAAIAAKAQQEKKAQEAAALAQAKEEKKAQAAAALALAKEEKKAQEVKAQQEKKEREAALAEKTQREKALRQERQKQEPKTPQASRQATPAQAAAPLPETAVPIPHRDSASSLQAVQLDKNLNAPLASTADLPAKPARRLIEYRIFGRDPFMPLVQDEDNGNVPKVENLEIVGILYDNTDRIGLFEDIRDKTKAFALRERDPVKNGYVSKIQMDKVLFVISELGMSRTYVMKLNKEKKLNQMKQDRPDQAVPPPSTSN